jgi:TatD DNase family protein
MGEGIPNKVRAVDCHAHLSSADFDQDRQQVVDKCAGNGVMVVDSALSPTEFRTAVNMVKTSHWIKLSAGWEARNLDRDGALEMCGLIEANQELVQAVGEVGLDRYWVRDHNLWSKQEDVFRLFIDLADRLGKPLVVHSRSAGRACIELLDSVGFRRVLMHAYDGAASDAVRASEKGFYFSIPPSVVRSEQKQKLVKHVALKRLMLESDSPVLGPEKGVRNVPINVFVSAEAIARIKGIGLEEALSETKANALTFFDLR